MCGIIGYIGQKNSLPILLDGLKRMEYRGYDSAGIALVRDKNLVCLKKEGKIENLEKFIPSGLSATLGLGHTRWATHGPPSDANAHPHLDCKSKIAIVHNGIIENYGSLRHILESRGHIFRSETDTEVIVHLIEEGESNDLLQNVLDALPQIKGAYGLVVASADEPDKIVAARLSSPLIIGVVGPQEYLVSSDATAILPYTRSVIYLNDEEVAVMGRDGFQVYSLKQEALKDIKKQITTIEWDQSQIEKGGFSHFMLKEIFEAPEAVENTLRGRITVQKSEVNFGGFKDLERRLDKIRHLFITSCGTSYYAGLIGKYMIEETSGLRVEVEHASEFRYRKKIIDESSALLAISQSGETADTLAALREAKEKDILTLGIVNAVGSTLAREAEAGIYNHIGPEIGVASSKAFVSQLVILALFSVLLGRERNLGEEEAGKILFEIQELPAKLRKILNGAQKIEAIAQKYYQYENFLYLGRKYNYPIALEGALKLKEISYIHAEGYAAGEMKHGPIAMVSPDFPSVFIAPQDSVYSKNASNIEEIKARRGKIVAIATEGDDYLPSRVDDVIYIPKTLEMLTPILSVLPLQLLAYYIAKLRGCDIDKPRNLAKSVTVE